MRPVWRWTIAGAAVNQLVVDLSCLKLGAALFSARDTISTRGGQAMHSTEQMVRDQPFIALAITGIACFAIGMMAGRGRN